MSTLSAIIADTLTRHVTHVFGLMGNGNAYLVDALERAGFPLTPVRHEVAAVCAADAYHRVNRELAAATTTYGPGFTNTLTGLAEARQARVPLVYVVGDQPTAGPRPWDIDQTTAASALGVPTITATREAPAQATLDAVWRALSERTPVVLAIPYDLAKAEVGEADVATATMPALPAPRELESGAAERIAARLIAAKRPLVLAGRGAVGARAELVELVERTGAAFATSAPARGLFNGVHASSTGESPALARDLGVCGGFASEDSARAIREADVVLVVGAGLNQFTMAFGEAFGERAHVVQIDLQETPTSPRVNEAHCADARTAVASIVEAVARVRAEAADASAGVAPALGATDMAPTARYEPGDDVASDGTIDPRRLCVELNARMPRKRIVATDGGHFIGWANMYFDLTAPDRNIMLGTHFQSIGLGFATGVGVAVAADEGDTVVLVSGDGGGLMGIADAETFVRVAKSAVVVIFNDSAYGAEIHQYGSQGLAEAPMRIAPSIDFAGIMRSLGATAHTITSIDELGIVDEWVAAGRAGTLVLDCRVSGTIIAPYMEEIMALNRR